MIIGKLAESLKCVDRLSLFHTCRASCNHLSFQKICLPPCLPACFHTCPILGLFLLLPERIRANKELSPTSKADERMHNIYKVTQSLGLSGFLMQTALFWENSAPYLCCHPYSLPPPSNGQGNPEMLNVTLQFFCSKQFTFPLTLLLCVLEQAARIFLDKCTSHHPLSKSDPSFINNAEKTHLIQSRYSLEYVYGPESILFFSALSALTLEKLYSSSTNFTSCLQENPYYTYMHKQAESELAIHKAVYFTSSEHRRQRRHLSEPLSL